MICERSSFIGCALGSSFATASSTPPTISYAGSPFAWMVGVDVGTVNPTNTGGASTTWALVGTTLPTGVSLNATTGVITGTPTADDGSASPVIRATNAGGTDDATLSVAVFTPLALTPALYVDVGLSTKWQDSARTTPVTADADPLGSLDDLSGGGRHAKQATAGDREVYKTSIINSLPVMRNAGDKFLRVTDDAALSPTTAFTLAVVIKTGTLAANNNYIASKWDFGVSGSWALNLNPTAGEMRANILTAADDTGTYGIGTIPANDTEKMITVIYDGSLTGNANRLKIRMNGVALTLTFAGTIPATIADSAADLCLGCLLATGEFGNFNGDTAAAVFVGRAITTQEAQDLEAFWTARYGSVVVA